MTIVDCPNCAASMEIDGYPFVCGSCDSSWENSSAWVDDYCDGEEDDNTIISYKRKKDEEIEAMDRDDLVQYIKELEARQGLYPADAFENNE